MDDDLREHRDLRPGPIATYIHIHQFHSSWNTRAALVMLDYLHYAEQAPTNLVVRQIGMGRVRVSWTSPTPPPSG